MEHLHVWGDNIKMDFRDLGFEGVNLIHLV
jgi:hypothetical protein